MVLNNLFPVFALIIFGSLLKRWRLTDDVFLKMADRLTYFIFFPALLFWKIGGASAALSNGTGLYKALISNPLILACISGILYANIWPGFPPFIDNTLKLASYVALPLAMLSIGGALTLGTVRDHYKLSLIASIFKLLVLPLVGDGFLVAFGVSDLGLKIGLIYFALPTSPALYILSSQLNSDTNLASASIALSTILSFFSLSIALLI